MATENPIPDPTVGKSGTTEEILESLTSDEIRQYVRHLRWEQAHSTTTGKSPYQSRAYYSYRSNNWIHWCRQILEARGETL